MGTKDNITTEDLQLLNQTKTNDGESTLWNDFDNAAQALLMIYISGEADEIIKSEKREPLDEIIVIHDDLSVSINRVYKVMDGNRPSVDSDKVTDSFKKLIEVLDPENEVAKKYIDDINKAFEKMGIDINEEKEGHFANMVRNRGDSSLEK